MPGEELARPTSGEILAADLRSLWHPYSPADLLEREPPLVVTRARGARLTLDDGREILDGNSSWWVAALGHGHPRLVRALTEQARSLCHTSLAGVTHEGAALLARELIAVAPPGITRVFYSDDGSTAVEAALKMALQYHAQNGRAERRRFVALEGAYHGDTAGVVSLGGVELFRRAFGPILFEAIHVPSPGEGEADEQTFARAFAALERRIEEQGKEIAAVVVEPIVQGAGGMRIYDPRYLAHLRALTDAHGVLLICDEVFAGYGRTGTMWACQHAGVTPDILCTAKGFSGGMLPMAATLATEQLYDGFRGGRERAFLHGHSFTGNPLGAAVAREVLAVFRDEEVLLRAKPKAEKLARAARSLDGKRGVLRTRALGMIAAADLGGEGYLGEIGWRVYREGLKRGAYLRPLGATVYLAPPLTIPDDDLEKLCAIFVDSVEAASSRRS